MNKLNEHQQLLVIMMEECGELIQACSKLLRRQEELYHNSRYVQQLKDEMGDVYTLLDLMHEWDVVSWTEMEDHREEKREKLSKWSDLIED